MKKYYLLTIAFVAFNGFSQTTFNRVYTILQTNCTNPSCHDNSAAGGLNLTGTENDVYNALVNVTPTNASAKSKDYKLVDPGHVYNSFLMRKINNGLEANRGLDTQEGAQMPKGGSGLKNEEIELISSWILYGAPQTGTPVNEQNIIDYYNGKGLAELAKPPAPDSTEGFQLHFGSVYLAPKVEVEFFKKEKVTFKEDIEVTRLESFINGQSHHFLLYKFDNVSDANATKQGLRQVPNPEAFANGISLVAGWQFSADVELPEGTGYFWDKTTYLELNYHFLNYSPDSVLKAELYMNVYYQPRQSNTIEMYSDLVTKTDILIGAGQTKSFSDIISVPSSNDSIFIWLLSSHTHKYGTAYDIYLRNPDGTKSTKIYDGNYNTDYTFNQGFYDWEHPAVRYFDPLLPVPLKTGLVHEATFNNTGTTPVWFGLTTKDEMMLIFMQYTKKLPSSNTVGIQNSLKLPTIQVYPNPTNDNFYVYLNSNLTKNNHLEMYDLTGKQVYNQTINSKTMKLSKSELNISNGIYLLKLTTDNSTTLQKVIITE